MKNACTRDHARGNQSCRKGFKNLAFKGLKNLTNLKVQILGFLDFLQKPKNPDFRLSYSRKLLPSSLVVFIAML